MNLPPTLIVIDHPPPALSPAPELEADPCPVVADLPALRVTASP